MATRCVEMPTLKFYLKKRNIIILSVLLGLFLLISIGIFAYFIESTYQDFLQSVVFIFGVIYLIGVLVAKQMMFTVSMYTHYYRMIEDNMPPFDVDTHPYLPNFDNQLSTYQFTLGVHRPLYQIHYRVFPKLPYVKRTGLSIIWIVITKGSIDTYDSRIEDDVAFIKSKIMQSTKVQNEITMVFHEASSWNDQSRVDAQKIVNFYVQNRAMITIPCAVISANKQVYALRPTNQFPNKFYYVAIKFLMEITNIKKVQHGQ
jgi:hypothetical protein